MKLKKDKMELIVGNTVVKAQSTVKLLGIHIDHRMLYRMFCACCLVSHMVQFFVLLFSQYTHDHSVSLLGGMELTITSMLMTHSYT